MSYNISESSVRRWERTLIELLSGNDVTIRPAGNTSVHITAYMIREALLSARQLKIEPYHKLDYIISPRPKEGIVVCRPRMSQPVIVSSVDPTTIRDRVLDEFDVVESISDSQQEYVFPSFSGDVDSVRSFVEHHGYNLTNENPLTIEKVITNDVR